MATRKKTPVERILVVDQVGKRHIVVKYVARAEPGAADADEPEIEFRLANGHRVEKTGDDTFQSTDGRLRLKVV
jgi:hypothetical protein